MKYIHKDNIDFLLKCLEYKYSLDWLCERYIGLHMKWDYDKQTCDVSMPGYIERALQQFAHKSNKRKHLPHDWNKPNFGTKIHYN